MSDTTIVYKVSRVLKKKRMEKGITQENLAFESGVSKTLIQTLESKGQNITMDKFFKIAKALDFRLAEFDECMVDHNRIA